MTRITKCIVCRKKSGKKAFNSQDRFLGIPGKFSVHECAHCKLLYIHPQPTKKKLMKYYASDKYFAYNASGKLGFFTTLREYVIRNYYTNSIFPKITSFLIQNSFGMPKYIKNGKVLDVGCGTGDILLLLKKLGFKPYGLEIDKNAVSVARKKGLDVKLGTFEKITSFKKNYFDTIRLYHVIEHVPDPISCLRILKNKLKKNGEVIISTPNGRSVSRFLFGTYWTSLDSPRHLFIFSPSTLSEIAKREGFKVTSIEYTSSLGIIGSFHFLIQDKFNIKLPYLNTFIGMNLLYPLEMLLVILKLSDAFTIKLIKS